jgi:hypothetical protein
MYRRANSPPGDCFWVLHRFIKGKNTVIIGRTALPDLDCKIYQKLNERTILKVLNQGEAFDFELNLQDKDLLYMHFKFDGDNRLHCNYGFEYKNGQWKTSTYSNLRWMWHHEKLMDSKIKNAII